MKQSIQRTLRIAVTAAMVVTLVVMTAGLASAATPKPKVTYNSVPTSLPGNVPSQPFQAQQTSEFGDSVMLATGPRHADSVTVVMSSWGCQSGTWNGGDCVTASGANFTHPITVNLYSVLPSGQPGTLLASRTQSFAIPFRPSADATNCTGADAGKWHSTADNACYNGFATKLTFNFLGSITLPADRHVIWTVAFNTSGYGAFPLGYGTTCAQSAAGCGYDSLNVGVQTFTGQPSAGTDVDPSGAVLNSATAAVYCDGGTGGTGTLRLDSPCWTGYTPLATIRTK
jgi:hypothetical protein